MENLQAGTLALEHRYDVRRRVGRHGYITLYRGTQEPFGKPVWVKTYEALGDAEATATLFNRLEKTTETVSRLDGPGILGVLDYGELEDGVPFVVSERAEAMSLADLLAREGTLGIDATATLVGRLADILHCAHQQTISHGALAPQWIYLPDERLEQAKVGHFQTTVSLQEMLASTTDFMTLEAVSAFPPEMVDGAHSAAPPDRPVFEPQADGWAVGVIAYVALVGMHPFLDDNSQPREATAHIRNQAARPLSELGIASPISNVVDKALHKSPDARWDSIRALADAFESAAHSTGHRTHAPAESPQSISGPDADSSSVSGPPKKRPADASLHHHDAQQAVDESAGRDPGPSDRLMTIALVLLVLTNLLWLFYVTAHQPPASPPEPADAQSKATPASDNF